MRLLLSMGLRPDGRVDRPLHGVLRELLLGPGATARRGRDLRWRTPTPHTSGPLADQELTAPAVLGAELLQPTLTEVLRVDLERLVVLEAWSHPLLHAVHAVAPRHEGGWWVACAGNDLVLEVSGEGAVVRCHWLRSGDNPHPSIRDFRTLHHDALKPHSHHPNHVSQVGDETWVTCFETREAFALQRPERRVRFEEGFPHDGRPSGGLLWFTVVTGHVVAVDPATLERVVHIDLNAVCDERGLLGWCRGIHVDGTRAWVGMSMLRSATHREVARWLVQGRDARKLPTRVLELDLDRPRVRATHLVGNKAGGTIYGITGVRDREASP